MTQNYKPETEPKTKWFELSDLIPVHGLKGIERVQSSRDNFEGIEREIQIRKEMLYVMASGTYHILLPIKGAIILIQHYDLPQKVQSLLEMYL